MARTNPEARDRLVAAAADMLRRRGLNATSIREVAKHAAAPLGSTYHYFPDGKAQMVSEAVRHVGAKGEAILARCLEKSPQEGVSLFLDQWRKVLINTEFRAGCPVMAVAVEEPEPELQVVTAAAGEVFERWEAVLTQALMAKGKSAEEATDIANLILAGIEGAIILCRARRDITPFDRIAREIRARLV